MDDIKNDLRAPDAEEQVLGVADTSGYCNMSAENGIVEETYFNADCTKNEICFVDPQADYTFEISSSATDNMSCSVDPLSSGDSCENDKYLMRSYANLQTVEGGNSSWANILNPNEELSSNFELASSETSSDSFHSNTSEGSNSNLVPDESEDAMEILARTLNQSIDLEKPIICDVDESLDMSDTGSLDETIIDGKYISDTEDAKLSEISYALIKKHAVNIEKGLIIEYDESSETSISPLVIETTYVDQSSIIEPSELPKISDTPLMNRSIDVEIPKITDYNESIKRSDSSVLNQTINVDRPIITEDDTPPETLNALALHRTINVENSLITEYDESAEISVAPVGVGKRLVDYDESLENSDISLVNETINVENAVDTEYGKLPEISDALPRNQIINVENPRISEFNDKSDISNAPLAKTAITISNKSTEQTSAFLLNRIVNVEKPIIADDAFFQSQKVNVENKLVAEHDELHPKTDTSSLNQTINFEKLAIREDDKVTEISDALLSPPMINVEQSITTGKYESPEKPAAPLINQTTSDGNISITRYSDSPEKSGTTDLNQTITMDKRIIRDKGEGVKISDWLHGNQTINAEKFLIPETDESPEKRDSCFMNKTVRAENISISMYSPAPTDLNQTITMDKPEIRKDDKVVEISDGSLGNNRINVEKCILPEKAESPEKREARFMNQTLRVENISGTTYSDSPEKPVTTDLNQTITIDQPIIREDGEVVEISDGLLGNHRINAEKFIIPEKDEFPEKRDSSFMHKTVRAENISISAYSPATTDLNQTITMDKRVIREDGKVVDISDGPLGGHRINAEKCILPEKAESPENRESRFMNQTLRVENISLATYSDSPEKSDTTDLNQTITMDKPVIREDSKVVDISDGSLRGHRINADKCILPEKAESPKNRESRFMNQTLRVENISLTTYSDSPEKSDTTDLNQTITMDKRIIRDDGEVVEISHGLHGNQTIDAQKFIISENDESPEKRDARLMNQTIHVENSSVTTHSDSPEISDPTDLNQTITMDRPIIIGDGKVTEISDELVGNKTINVEKRLTHEKEESPGKRDATVMNQTQHVENFSVTTCNDSPEKSVSTPLNQKKKDISESFLGTEMKNVEESMTAEKDESSKKTSAPLINQTIGVQDPLVNNYKDLPEKLTTTLQSETIDAAKRIITEYDIISETSNVFVNKPIEKSAAPLIKSSIDAGKSLSPLRQSVVVENPVNTKCNGLSETADKTSDAHLINQTLNVMKRIITEHEASSKISGVPLRLEVVHKKVNDLLLGNKDASQINSKNIVEQLTKKFNELTKQTDMLVINADKIRKNIAQADQTILVNVLDVEAKVGKLKKCQNISEQYQLLVSSQNRKVALTIHASKEMEKPLTDAQARLASAMQRYGKAQALIESLKQNEEITKSNIKNIETQLSNIREKCQRIEDQFESNKKSQNRLSQEKENYQNDIAKQQAMIKRLKIKTLSMEALIEQKSQECKSIATLCEDITRKHQLETTRKCNENLDNV
ncbi:uncharacterized protein LOC125504033 isoform X2 [Dendroctonus ponderosae]|uniref:uncharacterized protein LOC109540474 isoform X2 n=1 Tax=Dendroctonus ponderosae TaxID=77166 RepID=UPI002034E5C1|nr:uncharacterized protein LOC109540474 isoform X2 [Dendroctonus ponderosae]XP_048521291.1 uncharacterized protein LOC125504033 isoform X2 [Dendroctonus ponderosae]